MQLSKIDFQETPWKPRIGGNCMKIYFDKGMSQYLTDAELGHASFTFQGRIKSGERQLHLWCTSDT